MDAHRRPGCRRGGLPQDRARWRLRPICVVGIALDDGAPITIYEADWKSSDGERRILEALSCQLTDWIDRSDEFTACVIGHNVSAFDLRFLAQRSIVNGIRPHITLARAAQAKPWESEKVFDTMVQWTGSASVRVSLDKLCKALSIQTPKGDITGAVPEGTTFIVFNKTVCNKSTEALICDVDIFLAAAGVRLTSTEVATIRFDGVTAATLTCPICPATFRAFHLMQYCKFAKYLSGDIDTLTHGYLSVLPIRGYRSEIFSTSCSER